MAKFAEKLSLLLGFGDTILARLHKTKTVLSQNNLKPQFLLDKVHSGIISSALKKFPEISEVSGFDTVLTAANENYAEFEDYYYTFVDTMQFTNTTCTVIDELTGSVGSFHFEKNPVLTESFLELTAILVRSLLLFTSIADRKVVAPIFSKLYTKTNQKPEENWAALGNFIVQFDQPIKALHKVLKDTVPQALGHALIELMNPLSASFNVDQMRKTGVLSITNKPAEMCIPPISQAQLLIRLSPKIYTWVVFGFLLTPEQFVMPEPIEILKVALQQAFVVPLYLNEMCYIHAEYENIFSGYKSPNKQLSKQLKKDKKVFGEALIQAVQANIGAKSRADRRTFIRQELKQLVLLCKDFPGLLGPKIEIIWGTLALAKEEVFLYFAQKTKPPPKSVAKSYQEKNYTDPYISELIYYIEELSSIIRQYKYIIQQYFIEYLSSADLTQAQTLIDKLIAKGASGRVATILQSILTELQGISVDNFNQGYEYSFQALRLNWFRIEIWLMSPGCPAGDINSNVELCKRMNLITHHSKNVDAIDYLVWDFGSLHGLVHYSSAIQKEFESCLSNINSIPYISSWLHLVSKFPESVSSVNMEEKPRIADLCKTMMEQFLQKIAGKIGSLIDTVASNYIGYQSQLEPTKATALIKTEEVEGQVKFIVSSNVQAGEESRPKAVNKELFEAELTLGLLVTALRGCEQLYVNNLVFSPLSYIRDVIMNNFKEFIIKNVHIPPVDKEATITVQRPSVLLQRIKTYQQVIQNLNYFSLLNISSIVEQVISELTYHPILEKNDNFSWLLEKQVEIAGDRFPLLGSYIELYTDFLVKKLDTGAMLYSPSRKSFISQNKLVKYEEYCSVPEFAALAELIGSRGIQFLDRNLLQYGIKNLEAMKDLMTANVNELKEFAAVYRTNDCIPTARKVNNIDGFAQKAISLGNTFVFRKLIYEGLGVASKKLIPMIYKSVENLFNLYERNIYMTDALTNGDFAAQSLGIDIGTADITFIGMAKPIADADPSLWSLLPFMFAATIFSTSLTTSVFKPSIDAFSNNAHVLVECYSKLLVLMRSLSSEDDYETIKQDSLQKYVEVSSIIVLRLIRIAAKELQKKLPFTSLSSVFILLDMFVQSTEGVTKDMLDNTLSYSLMRSLYHDLYIADE